MGLVDYDDGSRIIENVPVYHQGNTGTCAQACVTSVLNYWGYNVSYEDVISKTSNLDMSAGMTPEQMMWYFRKYNLQARVYTGKLSDLKRLIDKGLPTVIAFDENIIQHSVVVIGYNDYREVVFYNDSMYGEVTEEPYSDFIRAWSKRRANTGGYFEGSLNNILIQVNR